MTLNIKATGVELTEALKKHVEDKMNAVKKYFDNIFTSIYTLNFNSSIALLRF